MVVVIAPARRTTSVPGPLVTSRRADGGWASGWALAGCWSAEQRSFRGDRPWAREAARRPNRRSAKVGGRPSGHQEAYGEQSAKRTASPTAAERYFARPPRLGDSANPSLSTAREPPKPGRRACDLQHRAPNAPNTLATLSPSRTWPAVTLGYADAFVQRRPPRRPRSATAPAPLLLRHLHPSCLASPRRQSTPRQHGRLPHIDGRTEGGLARRRNGSAFCDCNCHCRATRNGLRRSCRRTPVRD